MNKITGVEQYFKNWEAGSTCRAYFENVWSDDRFMIIKHHGHTAYIDRMSGTTRCGVYYLFIDTSVENTSRDLSYPTPNRDDSVIDQVTGKLPNGKRAEWIAHAKSKELENDEN